MAGQHKSSYTLVLPLAVLLWMMIVNCDPAFEPLKENNRYIFSISGYLDASADTQWVRVMPVRDSLLYEPGPIDATVTLEEVGSNESTTMNDSLFSYLDGGGSYAHVFWTTMDLLPEHSYRLTAERSNGKLSSVEVTLPADYPTPIVQDSFVYIDKSIDRLSDIQTVYHGRDSVSGDVQIRTFSHFQPGDTTRIGPAYHNIYLDPTEEDFTGFPPVFKKLIWVVAAGPDYHKFSTLHDNVINLPEEASNVKNGLGYLSGIVSKTIPYKSCYDQFGIAPCPTDPPPW